MNKPNSSSGVLVAAIPYPGLGRDCTQFYHCTSSLESVEVTPQPFPYGLGNKGLPPVITASGICRSHESSSIRPLMNWQGTAPSYLRCACMQTSGTSCKVLSRSIKKSCDAKHFWNTSFSCIRKSCVKLGRELILPLQNLTMSWDLGIIHCLEILALVASESHVMQNWTILG